LAVLQYKVNILWQKISMITKPPTMQPRAKKPATKKPTAKKPMTRREKAQEKELDEIANLAERLRLDKEAQKTTIETYEQLLATQRKTIDLQRKQLALQAGIFTRMFTSTAQWQQQMQSTVQGIPPA
jgi:ribosome-binding protein aMBF1 (putative translation factor)